MVQSFFEQWMSNDPERALEECREVGLVKEDQPVTLKHIQISHLTSTEQNSFEKRRKLHLHELAVGSTVLDRVPANQRNPIPAAALGMETIPLGKGVYHPPEDWQFRQPDPDAKADRYAKWRGLRLESDVNLLTDPHSEISSEYFSANDVLYGGWSDTLSDQLIRFVNIAVVDANAKVAIPHEETLLAATCYFLRLNIGPFDPENVVLNAADNPFPSHLLPYLPEGHWLEAVVVSDNFVVSSSAQSFFLPREGPSWVCDCQREKHHQCHPANRRRHLFFDLRTPASAGCARLRVMVYYHNNLIQSQLLTAAVGDAAGGYYAWVDYSLSAALDDLDSFPPRGLNILTNANADDSHRIVFHTGSADGEGLVFNLTDGQIRGAIDAAREALRDVHIEEVSSSFLSGSRTTMRNRFGRRNEKSLASFTKDLRLLAVLGWQLWTALMSKHPERRTELRTKALAEPTTIQISRTDGSSFVFPWALVYDIPIDVDPDELQPCELLTIDWDQWCRTSADVPSCPCSKHSANTLCPFGFWGLKHIIEMPPASRTGYSVPRVIRATNAPPTVTAALSSELDKVLTDTHLTSLSSRLKGLSVRPCHSRSEVKESLAQDGLEVAYFYCHGRRETIRGMKEPVPFLEIGEGERIRPSDIIAWEQSGWSPRHWRDTSPLVFINGCHTTELIPETLVNFVDVFMNVRASGVIGTEVAVHQQVAGEIAEEFFFRLQSGISVGQALKEVRLTLLKKGNLLGLAYTPYCSADLVLVPGEQKNNLN
ncbi:hypothetical protein NA78x_002790 [Anatilimnocola sp. NA78]|uniref:hypothetical protein n=1 Tax=Anatilimnocola sp. NA78 TaxID=3415683 RepID=UPI003CE4FF38